MRIAVNTRFLLAKQLEGFGWFTYEHFKRITQEHPEHEFIFLFDRPFDSKFIFGKNVSGVVVRPPARHPVLWHWWFEYSIPRVLRKLNADLFISTDGFMSMKTDVPTLLVIHDLAFEHYPEYVPASVRRFYRKNTPQYASRAKHIVTVSEFTKQDVVKRYGIDKAKISVVHNGASSVFEELSPELKSSVKVKYTNGHPYFLFVGALHPRKNVSRLLQAFDLFKERVNKPFKLLVAGREMFGNNKMRQTWNSMSFKEDVIFTNHLHSAELAKVNGAAHALVYVSTFEGFGIPIVEAMKCAVPIIASNKSAIPEVAGNSAEYVNPFSIEEIGDAMIKMVEDESIRSQLARKAKKRSAQFSWDKAADELWNVVQNKMIGKKSH